jgi:aspartate/methionine/tyrosine aminotransferase
MKISSRALNIGAASSIEQNELVYRKKREGLNPIVLSYGEAPFKLTPFSLDEEEWDRGCHYSESLGVPEFREEIANYVLMQNGVEISASDNILVSAGSKIISFFISQAILNPGDSIVLHEPSWVSYQEHAKLSQANTIFLEFYKSVYDLEEIIKANANIRLIYLNNPNNPRGYVYKEAELSWLADFCCKRGIFLAIDESYSDFVISEEFFSCINLFRAYPNVVIFNSLSKNFGLSGWRLGYCIADAQLIQAFNRLNQHLITCAPTCLQLSLVGKLAQLKAEIYPQIVDLNSKRNSVVKLLEKYRFQYLSGSSTFYIFIDVSKWITNTKQFVIDFLESDNVSVIPGGAYGKSTHGFIRLSFAIESLDRIDIALSRLSQKLKEYS